MSATDAMSATEVRESSTTPAPGTGSPGTGVSRQPADRDARARLDWRLLATVIVTAIAASVVIEWLTPPPVHPEQQMDALSILVNGAFYGFVLAGAYFLVERKAAWGYGFIAAAAWSQFAGVLACPLSGHHDFGAWWAGQMAVCIAFAVVSTVAALISRQGVAPGTRSRP
jgi:hypothetical protein